MKKRKLLAMALSSIMAFSLVACGNSGSTQNTEPPNPLQSQKHPLQSQKHRLQKQRNRLRKKPQQKHPPEAPQTLHYGPILSADGVIQP